MNQILVIKNSRNVNYKKYLSLFFFSISSCIIIIIYFIFSYFIKLNNINATNLLKSTYTINTLYGLNNNYTRLKFSNNIYIIGLIEIPKINISYPIIEYTTENHLKISVCRFSGPLPNRIGNLCIAGHNYKNNTMFSNIHQLNIGDSIYITDLNNTRLEYIVYNKFKVKENNLSCVNDSNNVEATLITCNSNNNSERIIIKAKVKGT